MNIFVLFLDGGKNYLYLRAISRLQRDQSECSFAQIRLLSGTPRACARICLIYSIEIFALRIV